MADALRPGDSPGFLLWRATLGWQRRVTAALKPLGLTHVQSVILVSAWWLTTEAEEQPSQKRIAEHASTDAMMTSQVIRALVGKGLLARTADPEDARIRRIEVTADGAVLAARAVRVVEETDRRFFEAAGDPGAVLTLLRSLDG